jgi:hypothetical protein
MATTTGTRAADTFPAYVGMGAGALCAAYGSYDLAANPTIADVHKICKLPRGAVVLGGFMRAEDIDANATETLDIDVGFLDNGVEATDSDAFGNFGVGAGGDAVTGYLPEGGTLLPLNGTLKDGPVTLHGDTVVTLTFVAAAATFAAGTITVVVHYVCP